MIAANKGHSIIIKIALHAPRWIRLIIDWYLGNYIIDTNTPYEIKWITLRPGYVVGY